MADKSLDDVPKPEDIDARIDSLHLFFLEAYRRHHVLSKYPASALTMKSDDEAQGQLQQQDGVLLHMPAGNTPMGFYRRSDLLGMYVPTDVPPFYATQEQGGQRWAQWAAMPPSEDSAVDAYARSASNADIITIKNEYQEVLDQCDTTALAALLPNLNDIANGLDVIVDKHKDREFERIAELFNEWKGNDADAAFEIFGQRVESAARFHRQMFAALVRSASDDGAAQAKSVCTLNNAVVAAYEHLHNNVRSGGDVADATTRATGKFLINRVPYLADALAAFDLIVEISADGHPKDAGTNWLLALTETKIQGSVPTVELVQDIRDKLVAGANDEFDKLKHTRDKDIGGYLTEASEDWLAALDMDLVPGYSND